MESKIDRLNKERNVKRESYKQIQNETPTKSLLGALTKSSNTVSKINGRTMTDEAVAVHPTKTDDEQWTAEEHTGEGKLAMLEEREVSRKESLSKTVDELQEEYSEHFESSPNSMRVYVKGEGVDATVGVAVYDPTGDYAGSIAEDNDSTVYDSETLEVADKGDTSVDVNTAFEQVEMNNLPEDEMDTVVSSPTEEQDSTDKSTEQKIKEFKEDLTDKQVEDLKALARGESVYKFGQELETVEMVDSGEEYKIDDAKVHRGAIVKVTDQLGINIRAGAGLKAKVPVDDDFDDFETFVASMYEKDEKARELGHKSHFINLADYDENASWSDVPELDIEDYTQEVTSLNEQESNELKDALGDRLVSDMSEDELNDMFDSTKADEVNRMAPVLDKAKGGKSYTSLPSVGIGGSINTYYGNCYKNCANCGNHGPYERNSYRDGSGNVKHDYIGKV